jgi:hypothetical protein
VATLAPAVQTLHVTNGASAAGTLRETALAGSVLAWDDVLHEGPLAAAPPAELRALRAGFLAERGWGRRETIERELEWRDGLLDEAVARRRPVVLWFEHDLHDQLQLLQILAAIAATGVGDPRVELLVVGDVPGRPDFHGLGELDARELEALWPRRVPLAADVTAAAQRGWAALCGDDPRALASFARIVPPGLPFLGAALERLLEELPAVGSGLARSERQLLEAVEGGADTPGAAFVECGRREQAPYAGDDWMWLRLHELGTGERPLLQDASGGSVPLPPPLGDGATFVATRLRLTPAGREALAGSLDRVDALGLDRWLGGTHLQPGNVWRWDASRRVVRPPR